MQQKIVFFGSSKFVIPIIEILHKNLDLTLVVTTEKQVNEPVFSYCTAHNTPYISVSSSKQIINLKSSIVNPSLGIVADFGLILPPEILNIFPKGILNIHPSLLPKYRGPTPVQEAILNGDEETGVTIIELDEEVDHGPILTQVKEPIFENDTAQTLYERLFKIGANLLSQTINQYIKNEIKPSEQDHSKATFAKRLTRTDGYIDIESPPLKEKLDRMIRAYYPWPGVWGKWQIANSKWRTVKFLPEQKIQVEGGKPMSYKDFLNGYPEAKELIEKLA